MAAKWASRLDALSAHPFAAPPVVVVHRKPLHRPLLHEQREQEARDRADEAAAVVAIALAAGVKPDDPAGLVVKGMRASDVRQVVRTAYRRGRASRE